MAECHPNKYCYDGTCNDVPKPATPCVDSGEVALATNCQCLPSSTTNECPVSNFCYGNQCHASPRPTPCTTAGTTAITAAPCQCSNSATNNECAVSKYCYGGACQDVPQPPPVCATNNAVAILQECTCGAALCAANSYCWVGNACETTAKPLPPVSPSPQNDPTGVPSVPSPSSRDQTDNNGPNDSGMGPGNGINQGSPVPSTSFNGDEEESSNSMNNKGSGGDNVFGVSGLNLNIVLSAAAGVVVLCCCCVVVLLFMRRNNQQKRSSPSSQPPALAFEQVPPSSALPMNYLHNPMQPQHQPQPAFAPVAIEMTPQKPTPLQHGRTKTKLPDQWAKDKDAEGNAYYYHEQNGQTLWEAPPGSVQVPVEVVQQHIRTRTKLPDDWLKDTDANGQSYYYHATSGATAWEAPPGSVQVPVEVVQQHIRTKTKLPENWMKDTDANGQSYYYHATSGATAWDAPPGSVGGSAGGGEEDGGSLLPSASHGRSETIMPLGWAKDVDANLDKFYVAPSGAVQWEKPPGN